jgi:hypothetical protein
MPFSLSLHEGIVVGTCSGTLSLSDAKAGAEAVWANPDFRGRPMLWDFRDARLDFDPTEVRKLARFILGGQPGSPPRVCLVTARDSDFGLVRMFEVFREDADTSVRVFRDYDKALRWAQGQTEP